MNRTTIMMGVLAIGSAMLSSCAMNPLAQGYRSTPGVPKREWVNTNPSLIQPSSSGHGGSVSRYTNRGYSIIGYGQINARFQVDAQNARMLAVEKNADVAVFSRRDLGTHTERVAVPIATSQSSGISQYQNSNQYASQSQAAAQTTVYGYENQKYKLYEHKTTLLRKN
jgi:hypothetical protein